MTGGEDDKVEGPGDVLVWLDVVGCGTIRPPQVCWLEGESALAVVLGHPGCDETVGILLEKVDVDVTALGKEWIVGVPDESAPGVLNDGGACSWIAAELLVAYEASFFCFGLTTLFGALLRRSRLSPWYPL